MATALGENNPGLELGPMIDYSIREWAEQLCLGKVKILLQNLGLITVLFQITARGGGHELHPVNGLPCCVPGSGNKINATG